MIGAHLRSLIALFGFKAIDAASVLWQLTRPLATYAANRTTTIYQTAFCISPCEVERISTLEFRSLVIRELTSCKVALHPRSPICLRESSIAKSQAFLGVRRITFLSVATPKLDDVCDASPLISTLLVILASWSGVVNDFELPDGWKLRRIARQDPTRVTPTTTWIVLRKAYFLQPLCACLLFPMVHLPKCCPTNEADLVYQVENRLPQAGGALELQCRIAVKLWLELAYTSSVLRGNRSGPKSQRHGCDARECRQPNSGASTELQQFIRDVC